MAGTTVKIYAAATPSIRDFFVDLAPGNKPAGSAEPGQPIEVTQFSGKDRYQTTIEASTLEPAQALQETEARFRTDGWRPLMTPAPGPSGTGYSLWLTKGTQYAFVLADRAPSRQGSSVSVTEVTPAR